MKSSLLLLSFVLAASVLSVAPAGERRADVAGGVYSQLPAGQSLVGDNSFMREDWEYWENTDGTYENGWCWSTWVHEEPFYGAFAEGFYGPAEVAAVRICLTMATGCYTDEAQDVYIWGDGIEGPGCVLAMLPDAPLQSLPWWPEIGINEYEISAIVGNRFYIGSYGVWTNPQCYCPWHTVVDENGPGGDPWTCVPVDGGPYPPGWQSIPTLGSDWARTRSLGIGVYVLRSSSVSDSDEPVVNSGTWGQVKALFAN